MTKVDETKRSKTSETCPPRNGDAAEEVNSDHRILRNPAQQEVSVLAVPHPAPGLHTLQTQSARQLLDFPAKRLDFTLRDRGLDASAAVPTAQSQGNRNVALASGALHDVAGAGLQAWWLGLAEQSRWEF